METNIGTQAPEPLIDAGAGSDRIAPLRHVLIIAVSVFTGELAVMLFLGWTEDIHVWVGFADALLVTAVSLPLLQRFVLTPLKHQIAERKKVEGELRLQTAALVKSTHDECHQRQVAEALMQATEALNSSLVLEEVFDGILEQVQSVVPCRMVAVMLLRGDRVEVPRFRDATGAVSLQATSFPISRFPHLRAAATSRLPYVVADTAAEPAWPDIPEMEWVRSAVVVPLVEKDLVTGFLAVLSEEISPFDATTSAFLSGFAAHAAVALQNANLYRAERYARRTAETLSAASLDLTRSLNLQEVLDSLLRYLHYLIPYDAASIALLDGESRLTIRATAGNCPQSDEPLPTIEVCEFPVVQALITEQQSEIRGSPELCMRKVDAPGCEPIQSWLGVPLVAGERTLGLCTLEKRDPHFYTTEHMRLAEVLIAQAAMAIQNAQLFEQVNSGRERLQSLSHRLVQVQENERRYVASELHDEAGQVLTSLKLGLHELERRAQDPQAVTAGITALRRLADDLLEGLHRLAMDLRPVSLDHLGLVVALSDHVRKLDEQSGTRARFQAIGFTPDRLPPDMETALYRIAQEALTNVIRHAQASQVEVLLHLYPNKVMLVIEDDGIGFDATTASQSDQMGLSGMRERCEMFNGTLLVESAPASGTTVVVELPL